MFSFKFKLLNSIDSNVNISKRLPLTRLSTNYKLNYHNVKGELIKSNSFFLIRLPMMYEQPSWFINMTQFLYQLKQKNYIAWYD